MNVRLQLIAGFIAIAVFVLILFGYVAYQATIKLDRDKDLQQLHTLVNTGAQALSNIGIPLTETELLKIFPDNVLHNTLPLVLKDDGAIVNSGSMGKYFAVPITEKTVRELPLQNKVSGEFSINSLSFFWASAPIKGSNAKFILVSEKSVEVLNYSQKLGNRLFVIAFMIIWLAVWLAMFISKRIVIRLDQQNSALIYQFTHDDLTGLPNRRKLFEYLDERISGGGTATFALLVLDINNFREINDTLGHSAGDILLVQVGKRLQRAFSDADFVGRLGGDEFAIVVSDASVSAINQFSLEIQRNLHEPYPVHGMDIALSTSIGCASYPEHANDVASLIRRTEVAMYRAKKDRMLHTIYDVEFDHHNVRRLALIGDLRKSVKVGQLSMHYQPKIDFHTGMIASVESLVRWHHPEYGKVSPAEFVGYAEQSDFIAEFTLFTIRQSLIQCRKWSGRGYAINVAVNISANTLRDRQFPQRIRQLLKETDVSSRRLKLEITESAIMSDPEQALQILRELADMNIELSIDDFGTGYSSLSYLKRLPVTELKIDQSFVMDMLNNENDRIIVHSIIELAHNLGFKVVAEGIEDQATYDYLKQHQCDVAQGYLISRPLSSTEFDQWLDSSRWGVLRSAVVT